MKKRPSRRKTAPKAEKTKQPTKSPQRRADAVQQSEEAESDPLATLTTVLTGGQEAMERECRKFNRLIKAFTTDLLPPEFLSDDGTIDYSEMEAFAQVELGLSLTEFWYMAPVQFRKRYDRHVKKTERDERLAQGIEALLEFVQQSNPKNPVAAKLPQPSSDPEVSKQKPGPRPKTEEHEKLANIVEPYGTAWKEHKNLRKICQQADRAKVFVPKEWNPITTWKGGYRKHVDKMIKVIRSRLQKIGRLPATEA